VTGFKLELELRGRTLS